MSPPSAAKHAPSTCPTCGGHTPVGNAPVGNAPVGNAPVGNAPVGNAPVGNTSVGNTSAASGAQERKSPPRPVEIGDLIAERYRVQAVLGQGGFGTVYAAEQLATGQSVAVKMLRVDTETGRETVVTRFRREARITAGLRHPNTVRVIDVGETASGRPYIAMERLYGRTLEEELRALASRGEVMGQNAAIELGVAVLASLREAHRKGVVHRDLKPANIMLSYIPYNGDPQADQDIAEAVTSDAEVPNICDKPVNPAWDDPDEVVIKVLDFGIARPEMSSLTGSETALGTPAYMSPEQCEGRPLDGRSDLYALGVILFRCVTGRLPFAHTNRLTLMYQHAHAPIPDVLSQAATAVSSEFAACVHTALAKAADDRCAGAAEMRRALALCRVRGLAGYASVDGLNPALVAVTDEATLPPWASAGVAHAPVAYAPGQALSAAALAPTQAASGGDAGLKGARAARASSGSIGSGWRAPAALGAATLVGLVAWWVGGRDRSLSPVSVRAAIVASPPASAAASAPASAPPRSASPERPPPERPLSQASTSRPWVVQPAAPVPAHPHEVALPPASPAKPVAKSAAPSRRRKAVSAARWRQSRNVATTAPPPSPSRERRPAKPASSSSTSPTVPRPAALAAEAGEAPYPQHVITD